MTATEQMYIDRLKAIRSPKASSGGKKGGGILGALLGMGGLSGLSGAIPVDAPQGPLPDGGNLNQGSPLDAVYTGGQGTPALALGNPNREQIKIGPFFKPRVDQEAAAKLAQDPLAPVQLEKPTTGVGGFFRRLLGDNANERNAALAERQGQLRLQKWLIDQQTQGRMGVLDKQHQYEMERLKAASDKEAENIQYRTQLDLQAKQLENQWAVDNAGKLAKQQATSEFDRLTGIVGDPIAAAQLQEQILRAPIAKLMADAAESNARAQGSGAFAPDKVILPEGSVYLNGQAYVPDENGKLQLFTGQTGGGGFDPAAASEITRKLAAAKAEQNTVDQLRQPPTVFGGLKTIGSDLIDSATTAAGNTLQGRALGAIKSNTVDPVISYLKRIEAEKKARELMKRGLVNPIPTAE